MGSSKHRGSSQSVMSKAVFSKKRFDAVVAFCDDNRGFSYKGNIPWPYIKADHDHYMRICSTTKKPDQRNGIILGRLCWETMDQEEKTNPKLYIVVTSTSMPKSEPICGQVSRSFEEAIDHITEGPAADMIDKVFVLGGLQNYQHALLNPCLQRIYVTRILTSFPTDLSFPSFEHDFHRISPTDLDTAIQEENGIKFQFEVWERKVVLHHFF